MDTFSFIKKEKLDLREAVQRAKKDILPLLAQYTILLVLVTIALIILIVLCFSNPEVELILGTIVFALIWLLPAFFAIKSWKLWFALDKDLSLGLVNLHRNIVAEREVETTSGTKYYLKLVHPAYKHTQVAVSRPNYDSFKAEMPFVLAIGLYSKYPLDAFELDEEFTVGDK